MNGYSGETDDETVSETTAALPSWQLNFRSGPIGSGIHLRKSGIGQTAADHIV